MNSIEKVVYDLVKKNPKLKMFIRDVYQLAFDLLPRKKEYSLNPIDYKEGYFFGFHDVQAFSTDNKSVLANKLHFDLRMPKKEDFLEIGYFEISNNKLGKYESLGRTNSWNYHKGCRLQWVNESHIIFNCTNHDKMISKIINISNKEEILINYPIDSVSKDGKYATSFSYERLEKFMPGYGYCHSDEISFLNEPASKNTGLFLINLEEKSSRLIVNLMELANQSKDKENSKFSNHYVTHTLFSEDGRYVSFFHRWVGEETRKRYTRLMIYDLKKKEFFQIPTGFMVSHYVWNKNNQIIAYCNYNGKDAHTLLDVEEFSNSKTIAYPEINSDGHQSFVDSNRFVTDTYGDKFRMSKLYLVNVDSNEVKLIASVYSPNKFQTKDPHKHIACDLHPIVSENGKMVCFDTAKSGKRSLAIMSLDGI